MKREGGENVPSGTDADGSKPTRLDDAEKTRTHDGVSAADSKLPERIGDYRILSRLGEGGMGVVFEAEQQNPRRRVAVKVIRGGALVDEQRLKMFQREADTLARLRHPDIAAIYESGRTDDGEHFFAMEFVRGRMLHEFLHDRRRKLDRAEVEFRLRLFGKLCRAVHYAHQRGVIHRDLKPANVVVVEDEVTDGLPGVKVLDFGLARITDTDVAAVSVVTEVGVIKGTLPYMSPEQSRGNPEEIDIRTDVYALGVILFEMLTESRPVDVSKRSLVEVVRVICEEPPKSLHQVWSGTGRPDDDLETIVAKALEKDADRRYAGAAALAEDVERYLASQPILARPPSSAYLLRKFARRNKILVGGVLATGGALLAGVAVSTVLGLREARQRRAAEMVVEFQASMIGEVDPEQAGQRILSSLRERIIEIERRNGLPEETIAERLADVDRAVQNVNPTDLARIMLDQNLLEPAAGAVGSEFAERPLIAARLLHTIGEAYRSLGLHDQALVHLTDALELRERELGRSHTESLVAMEALANLHVDRSDYATAEELFRELLDTRRDIHGERHAETLRTKADLAGMLFHRGEVEQAEALYVEVLTTQQQVLGDAHLDTAHTMNNLAVIYFQQGRYDEAEPLWVTALATRRQELEAGHPGTLATMTNLAGLYRNTRRAESAERLYTEALGIQRRKLGDDHPRTLRTRSSLAGLYGAMGRREEAVRLERESLEARRRVHGEHHPLTLRSMNNLAVALSAAGDHDGAGELLRRLVVLDEEIQPGSQDSAIHMHSLGELLLATGELSGAEEQLHRALTIYQRLNHRFTGLALYQLAGVAARQNRKEDALDYLQRAHQNGYKRLSLDAPEFASLSNEPAFRALVSEAKAAAD